ncbi:hypothetical protein LEP1GSC060_2487 [Leptospira weilii serovar Ranarum str. ICFT]|uniref:Uncharacterized protein n=1 Tax=Leptospira weilii serovar Ranarum str. ICFT TaxID=1218598 RepID=N1WGX7_9LEPT|nr:hypothetical protein LEP1GSC060_2487 [Leptospira weilii serovar Ranarum str. ICFT]
MYPRFFSKRIKDALRIHPEDSYRDGIFRIFHLFDIIIAGFRERISSESRSFRLLWEHDRSCAFGLTLLVPWDLFLILVFASLFVRGPGWLKFFHNFPYERNDSADFFSPFCCFSREFYLSKICFS